MKQELTDDLDNKSEAIRTLNFDYESQIALLKEQIQALESNNEAKK